MTVHSRWLCLAISLFVIPSMGLTTVTAASSAPTAYAHTKKSSIPVRCKTRVKAKGTIKYSDWIFPDTMNGYQTNQAVTQLTLNAMFDGLFSYNAQAHIIPQMATNLPTVKNGQITNGGKTITIHIKKGLLWSNGSEITAADFKLGWEIGVNKATGPACSGTCDHISRIDTPDKYTLVAHFNSIYAPALDYAFAFSAWPVKWTGGWSANDVNGAATRLGQDASYNFENSTYPTDGAYQIVQYVRDDRIALHPMKYYNDENCGGAIANLIFAFYSNKPVMIAAAASKQTDVTQDYNPSDIPELRKHTDAYRLYTNPGFIFEHLELNVDPTYNGSANPLSSVNVRLALALALDKLGLIRSALGISAAQARGIIAFTPLIITPTLVQPFADKKITGQWDPLKKAYVQPGTSAALADARKLLAKTPFASGFSLDFFTTSGNPARSAQAAVVSNSWKKLGVTVNLNLVPGTKLFGNWDNGGVLDHGQFQVGQFAIVGSPDPDDLHFNLQSKYIDRVASPHSATNGNYSGMHDKVFDKDFPAASNTLDTKVRAKYYAAIQVELNEKAYWIPLYFRPHLATADSKVGNFENNPSGLGSTANIFSWKPLTG
jgi:peptide/nickel transport system substrate-binding protein